MKSTTPAIHMPRLPIRQIVDIFECSISWQSGEYLEMKNMLNSFLSNIVSFDEAFVAFVFLREVCHWIQFEKVDRIIFVYENIDIEL